MITCHECVSFALPISLVFVLAAFQREHSNWINPVRPSESECIRLLSRNYFRQEMVMTSTWNEPGENSSSVGDRYKLDPNQKYPMLPKCIIIGTPKGGTKALREAMTLHSKIEMARQLNGNSQMSFFNTNHVRGYVWYLQQMPEVYPDQIVIEKTPSYFYTEDSPRRMYEMDRNMKMLVCVRDPVERLISKLAMAFRRGADRSAEDKMKNLLLTNNGMSIRTNFSYIAQGRYSNYLKQWLEYFPIEQIHMVDSNELVEKPWAALQRVESFLGLEPEIMRHNFVFNETKGFYCQRNKETRVPECLGKSKGYPHPKMPDRIRKMLADHYRPYNQEFYNLTGVDYGWQ